MTRDVGSLWLIGCGNMAGAMLSRWLDTGRDPASVTVVDPSLPHPVEGVTVFGAVPTRARPVDALLLGVKPQMLDVVVPNVLPLIGPQTTLLSILAGIDVAVLRRAFPDARSVVRVMPNLPVVLGKGVVALHCDRGRDDAVDALMAPLGLVEWIEDEGQFDAITSLSGSGPAFVYRYIDALAKGGVALGIDPARAARMALATVEGAGAMAATANVGPATLAERVASKGGSTREGLDVLDRDDALDRLVAETLAAAERRNRALGGR